MTYFPPDTFTKYVVTQVDKTNTTEASLTDLSVTLKGGRKYVFVLMLHMLETTTGGIRFDFNGGTATATTFIADIELSGLISSSTRNIYRSQALASQYSVDDGSTNYRALVHGTFLVNAGGTFIPRFAQQDAAGTSSVLVGSSMWVQEIVP